MLEYANDNNVQLEALKQGYKLHGLLKDNSLGNTIANTNIQFNIYPDSIDKLNNITDKLKALNNEVHSSPSIIVDGEVISNE
jgi:hypothetical protein